jgi:hypothetical protein
MEAAEYPTVEQALRAGMWIDDTNDDLDLSHPDSSPENPYPVE